MKQEKPFEELSVFELAKLREALKKKISKLDETMKQLGKVNTRLAELLK